MLATESCIVTYKDFVDILHPNLTTVSAVSLFNELAHFAYTIMSDFFLKKKAH
jgi:hypothetical protein